jgi:hypothetical protein
MKIVRKIGLTLIAGSLAGVMSANASLTVQPISHSPAMTVMVHSTGSIVLNEQLTAGINNLLVNGVPTQAFCIDLFRGASASTDYYYAPLANSPLAPTGPMGAAAAVLIEQLWASYFAGATSSALDAAALQVAIWETVAAGVGTYTVTIDPGAVATRAAQMLANPGSVQADLTGLLSPKNQNYVVETPVPEPATMVAGALLLLPFGASILRLRKNRKA